MSKTRERVTRELLDQEDRTDYAVEFGDSSIALQIKALRLKHGWTQAELGERAGGMKQSRISDMENVDYSSWSVATLRRLAQAFDLPLIVSFESWGKFVDDVMRLSRSALERPPFDEDAAIDACLRAKAPEPSLPRFSSEAGDNVVQFPVPGRPTRTASAVASCGDG